MPRSTPIEVPIEVTLGMSLVFAAALSGCGADPALSPLRPTEGPVAIDAALPWRADASPDPATPTADRTIRLDPLLLAPGEERTACWFVPPDGIERHVRAFHSSMTPGSHHLIVFRAPSGLDAPARGPEACRVAYYDAMLPGAMTPESDVALPDGVALRLGATDALIFEAHYINAAAAPLEASATYRLATIPAGEVRELAGSLFFNRSSLRIPPGGASIVSRCTSTRDARLLRLSGHMHHRGLGFEALHGDTPIYAATDWEDPGTTEFAAPGRAIAKGDVLSWRCTFQNDGAADVVYGSSATDHEMCILDGMFAPAADSRSWLCAR